MWLGIPPAITTAIIAPPVAPVVTPVAPAVVTVAVVALAVAVPPLEAVTVLPTVVVEEEVSVLYKPIERAALAARQNASNAVVRAIPEAAAQARALSRATGERVDQAASVTLCSAERTVHEHVEDDVLLATRQPKCESEASRVAVGVVLHAGEKARRVEGVHGEQRSRMRLARGQGSM